MCNVEDRLYDIAKQVIINAVKYAVKDLYVSIADVTQHLLNSPLVVIKPPNKPPIIMTIPKDEYKTIQSVYVDSMESQDNITEIKIKNNQNWENIQKVKSDVLRELKYILEFTFSLNDREKAEIEVWLDKNAYLFSWDSVPGSDNEKLIKFLKEDFDIDWAEDSKIRKSDDSKTIRIFRDENSAEIMIDEAEEEEKATLKISDGRTCDLKVKNENGKLKIYKNVTIEEVKELSNEYKRFLDNLKDAIKDDMKTNNFLPNGTNGNENEFEWEGVPLEMEEFEFLGSILDKVITRTAPLMKNFGLKGKEKLIQTFFLRVSDSSSYGQFRYVLSNAQRSQVSADDSKLQKLMYDLIKKRTDPNIFSESEAKNLEKKIREMSFIKRINSATWSGDPKKTTIGYIQAIQGDISLYHDPGLFRVYGDLFKQHEEEKDVKDRYNEDYLKAIAELVMIGTTIDKNGEIIQVPGLHYLGVPIKEREGKAQGVLQIISKNKISPETRLRILDVIWHSLNEIKGYLHADTEHIKLSKKIAERRLTETMSVFAHLTAHSSTKVFTTPIRDSVDSIEEASIKLSEKVSSIEEAVMEPSENSDSIIKMGLQFIKSRLRLWERELPIIKRTAHLWENYLTVIDRYGKIKKGRRTLDPTAIKWDKMKNELEFYGERLFYSCANDLYDDKRYEKYEDLIINEDFVFRGEKQRAFFNLTIQPMREDSPEIWAHQEILEIHLINFLENAIEAANLTEAAKHADVGMRIIDEKYMKNIDIKHKKDTEGLYTILEISNDCGITEEEKKKLNDLRQKIEDFQESDMFEKRESTIFDIDDDGRKDKRLRDKLVERTFTSKSGGGLGWGVILAADYLHKLQVYTQESDTKKSLRRGKLILNVKNSSKMDRKESEGVEKDVTFEMYFPFPKENESIEFV